MKKFFDITLHWCGPQKPAGKFQPLDGMSKEDFMMNAALRRLGRTLLVVGFIFIAACGEIRLHRQLEQPIGPQLTTSVGGTVFHLNKLGDLPNAFGGRDIWGGKVDRGFAEMRLVGIEDQTLILDVVDVSRQSAETTMDRYKPFRPTGVVNVEVQQSVSAGSGAVQMPTRIRLDIRKQRDIVVAGIRVNIIDLQPYSVRYILQDLQPH
ncbi:MAG: hypothetical protein AB7T38_01500 [Nitrospirales bacterium]